MPLPARPAQSESDRGERQLLNVYCLPEAVLCQRDELDLYKALRR